MYHLLFNTTFTFITVISSLFNIKLIGLYRFSCFQIISIYIKIFIKIVYDTIPVETNTYLKGSRVQS